MNERDIINTARPAAVEITGSKRDYDPVLELVGNANFVLLGEASHGTHEFYRQRAEITMRLIKEKGFNVVAVEADWPDAYRVNRYIRGISDDAEPVEALGDFKRFPTWMWRNADVLDFVGWLREFNEQIRSDDQRTGFYGVDLYSLFTSIEAVVGYLEKVDPEAAKRARARYACFDHFGAEPQKYGYATTFGIAETCEDEVVAQLMDFRRKAAEYATSNGQIPPDEAFYAEQNARLVLNAERYYRSMFAGRVSSWNLRDEHMTETIAALAAHIRRRAGHAKVAVWAHNSHLGDARATDMGRQGELNVGQLMRQRFGNDARSIGFTTNTGSVTAASDWDGPAERKRVVPGLNGSYEQIFHDFGIENFWLPLRSSTPAAAVLEDPRLERAIGVIYLPQTERQSHYFRASLSRQFDGVLHFDTTRAVEPLERWEIEHTADLPETYPHAV